MAWFPWFMFGNWAYTETYMIHSKGYYIYVSLIQKCWLHITSYHIIWQNVVDMLTYLHLSGHLSVVLLIHPFPYSFLHSFVSFVDSLCITMQFFWGFLTMAAQVTMVFNINMVWRCDPSGTIIPVPGRYFSLLFDPVDCHQPVNVGSHLFLNRWNGWNGWMSWKSKIQTLMPFRHLEQKKPSETDDLGFFD